MAFFVVIVDVVDVDVVDVARPVNTFVNIFSLYADACPHIHMYNMGFTCRYWCVCVCVCVDFSTRYPLIYVNSVNG